MFGVRLEELMKVKIRVADPAGNITIFVMTPLERSQYAEAANQLLEQKKYKAEQVGFVEEKEDGTLHMQMMGGEFCGNATRSFGYLKSLMDEKHPALVQVDVSGSESPLDVEVDLEAGTSRTTMPLPRKIVNLSVPDLGTCPMVCFDGISHMIVKGPRRSDAFVQEVLKAARACETCDAYGIMFLEPSGDGMEKCYRMTPVVYVVETDSLVWESSCGSGSMACAVYLADRKADGTYVYVLRQPDGQIEATVIRREGKTVQCKMGGKVTISGELEAEIL